MDIIEDLFAFLTVLGDKKECRVCHREFVSEDGADVCPQCSEDDSGEE